MTGPLVTVVIPTYNRAHMVGAAIQSVLQQSYRHWELIVVDDASIDETAHVVQSVGDERVRYVLRERNGGVSAAQNSGIVTARGRYITFLHSDDEFLPTKLEKEVRVLEQLGDKVGGVECGVRISAADHEEVRLPSLRDLGYEGLLGFEGGVHIAPFLLRRELAAEIQFDETLPGWEDWDFILRLVRKCTLAFVDEPLVVLHRHAGPRLSDSAVQLKSLQVLLEKYRAEIDTRPLVRSHWHFKLARFHIRLRNMPAARAELLRSIVSWPWDPIWDVKRLLLAAATLAGGAGFEAFYAAYAGVSRLKRRGR